MNVRGVYLFLVSLLVAAICRGEIGIGDARDDVLRQLGKPTSIARRGDHEIFLYPKGGRIEFVDAKVVDVKGPLPSPIVSPTPAAPVPAVVPPVEQPTPTPVLPPKPEPAKPPPPKKDSTPKISAPKAGAVTTGDYNPAAASEELAKHVEKMDTPWGEAPERSDSHSPLDSLPEFLTGLAMRFVFTVVALKLAFKYWEMDAFWSGVF